MFDRVVPVFMIVAFAFLVAAPAAEAARAERWVRLATHSVDGSAAEELLDLSSAKGSFLGFQLRARSGNVSIERIVLKFAGAASHTSETPFRLRSGERTKVIARDDAERFADTLAVTYQKDAGQGRNVRLEIWALQSREGRDAVRPEQRMPTPPPPPRVGQRELELDDALLIAAKTAATNADTETLEVDGKPGKFKRLRLAARDGDAAVTKLSVVFDDGTKREFAINGTLRQNASTPWFDIDGSRFIANVRLELKDKTSPTAPVRFEIYGTPTDTWLSRNGEGGHFNDGWVLIGAQTAGFLGFDKDVIQLAQHGEGFSELRVNVRGRAITLNQLRVVYDSGEQDIVPVRTRIDAGDTFGPISLRSGQTVREVQARYRSLVIDTAMMETGAAARRAALVQVWAKR